MTTQIASVVFTDLETTGLPPQRPRITELSMVAVERGSMSIRTSPPRVVNKLLLCFNPEKTIPNKAASITGLTNAMLQGQSPFSKETCQLILGFLGHLQPPVCLVAHNGNVYDFPLLQAEFFRCQFNAPPEILCADSLRGFRKLDSDGVAVSRPLPAAAAGGEQQTDDVDGIARQFESVLHVADGKDNNKKQMPAAVESVTTPAKRTPMKEKEKKSYALGQVYKRVFGSEASAAHTSGGDTDALMMCAMAYSPSFLTWMDESAVPLNNCRIMYKQET